MRIPVFALAITGCIAALPAQADWLLAARQTRAHPGHVVPLSVVKDPVDSGRLLDARLQGVLETGDRRVRVDLVASADASPEAFRREYSLLWPSDLLGPAVLTLVDRPSSRLLLVGEGGASAAVEPVASPVGAPVSEPLPRPPVWLPLEPALTLNEPMYFLLGANPDLSARFQLSFKYRIFDAEGPVVDAFPFLAGMHFGYTQTSLWDLVSDSKPFRDTSYRPSLFYQWDIAAAAESRSAVRLRTGYEHESNGRDSETSRSIDTLFASADWRYRLADGKSYIGLTPKVWGYLDRKDNSDIYRYRGYGELSLRIGRDDGWLAQVKVRRAMGGKGSTQLDLSYPLQRAILSDAASYMHFQIFDGVGETLLDYNRSNGTQFRIGLSILR